MGKKNKAVAAPPLAAVGKGQAPSELDKAVSFLHDIYSECQKLVVVGESSEALSRIKDGLRVVQQTILAHQKK